VLLCTFKSHIRVVCVLYLTSVDVLVPVGGYTLDAWCTVGRGRRTVAMDNSCWLGCQNAVLFKIGEDRAPSHNHITAVAHKAEKAEHL
jgi:hypothetical protein